MQDVRTLNKMNAMFEVLRLLKRNGLQNVVAYFKHASACLPCVPKTAAGKAIWKIDNAVSLAKGN